MVFRGCPWRWEADGYIYGKPPIQHLKYKIDQRLPVAKRAVDDWNTPTMAKKLVEVLETPKWVSGKEWWERAPNLVGWDQTVQGRDVWWSLLNIKSIVLQHIFILI